MRRGIRQQGTADIYFWYTALWKKPKYFGLAGRRRFDFPKIFDSMAKKSAFGATEALSFSSRSPAIGNGSMRSLRSSTMISFKPLRSRQNNRFAPRWKNCFNDEFPLGCQRSDCFVERSGFASSAPGSQI